MKCIDPFADKSPFALEWTWITVLFVILIRVNGKGLHSWTNGDFHLFRIAVFDSRKDWGDVDSFIWANWWQKTTLAQIDETEKKNILESENSKREGLMLLINYNVLDFTS